MNEFPSICAAPVRACLVGLYHSTTTKELLSSLVGSKYLSVIYPVIMYESPSLILIESGIKRRLINSSEAILITLVVLTLSYSESPSKEAKLYIYLDFDSSLKKKPDLNC